MKRFAIWAFYGIGALAVAYLVLYTYAAFKGRDLQPGDPIHIFRKPNAPDYSARTSLRANGSRECAPDDGLCEAIQSDDTRTGLLGRFAPRNDGGDALITRSQQPDDNRRRRRV